MCKCLGPARRQSKRIVVVRMHSSMVVRRGRQLGRLASIELGKTKKANRRSIRGRNMLEDIVAGDELRFVLWSKAALSDRRVDLRLCFCMAKSGWDRRRDRWALDWRRENGAALGNLRP